MSVHYIIDGYNLIKQIPSLSSEELRDSRDSLIHLIKTFNLTGSHRNKVTIVFDGREDVFSPGTEREFDIIFSRGESADSKIKKIVSLSGSPRSLIVVSEDKEIVFFARSYGANTNSINEFLSRMQKQKKTECPDGKKDEVSSKTAEKITQELKKIWLKDYPDR